MIGWNAESLAFEKITDKIFIVDPSRLEAATSGSSLSPSAKIDFVEGSYSPASGKVISGSLFFSTLNDNKCITPFWSDDFMGEVLSQIFHQAGLATRQDDLLVLDFSEWPEVDTSWRGFVDWFTVDELELKELTQRTLPLQEYMKLLDREHTSESLQLLKKIKSETIHL